MRNVRLGFIALGLMVTLSASRFTKAAELVPLNDETRAQIDRQVMELPDFRTEKPDQEFLGTLAGWGIARTPLKPEEELALAQAAHQSILATFKTSPTPAAAVRVLKRLTQHLPGVARKEFRYSLTIIEEEDYRAWTAGGGFLYLSRSIYEALIQNPAHAEDRLAFVLGHELGHIVRQHCRLGYQLLKLQEFARREGFDEAQISKVKKTLNKVVDVTGGVLRFLYEPGQEYQADLFAAYLCQNAGFDVEAGWDVLRQGVLTETQGGNWLHDPAHGMLSNNNAPNEKNRPSAGDRLRQLGFERDGVIVGDQYGLWEFDRDSQQWIKPQQLRVAADDRVVMMVHGMDASLSGSYLGLAKELAKDRAFRDHRLLGFQYPGDTSLARAGMFLHREIARTFAPTVEPAFVCHSAGGLVVRYHCEVKGGAFRQIIMQATPNQGSDWAALQPVVEMKQIVSDLADGYSQAVENAILDGQGQIGHDLQPDSLFLNFLNHRRFDRSDYAIIRGRKFSGFRMLVLEQGVELGRKILTRKLEASNVSKLVRERAMQSLEKLHLPDEVRDGDLIVSTKRAELEGVTNVQTFTLHHGELSRDPEAIAATIALLKSNL